MQPNTDSDNTGYTVQVAKPKDERVTRYKKRVRRYLRNTGKGLRDDLKPDSGFSGLFSTWGRVARVAALLTVAIALALLTVWILPSALGKTKVTFTESSVRWEMPGGSEKWLTSVPASQLWVNTGIKIMPNQKALIRASGRVNLAMHRLVSAAIEDRRPTQQWFGPEGGILLDDEFDKAPPKDKDRGNLLLFPDVPKPEQPRKYGLLVGVMVPDGETSANLPGKDNPRPPNMFEIGSKCERLNDTGKTCTLWMTANDVVIISKLEKDPIKGTELRKGSESSKTIYLDTVKKELMPKPTTGSDGKALPKTSDEVAATTKAEGEAATKEAEKRWKYIDDAKYWNLWYDDNIGEYQVTCEIE